MYENPLSELLDSAIWQEAHTTLIVWMTLLGSMAEDGTCYRGSIQSLSERAFVSLEKTQAAMSILEDPSKNVFDHENRGRSLKKVQDGWIVINPDEYPCRSSKKRRSIHG